MSQGMAEMRPEGGAEQGARAEEMRVRRRRSVLARVNVDYLREAGDQRFFFSPRDRDEIAGLMEEHFPSILTDRVAEAEGLLRRESHVGDGALPEGRELLSLGECYWYTDDDRLVEFFQAMLSRWGSARKKGGPRGNALSPWERTSRLLGWLAATHCFLSYARLDGGDVTNYLAGLTRECEALHAWIERHPGACRERGAALAGLAVTGMLYPELFDRRGWQEEGLGELAYEVHTYLAPGERAPDIVMDGLEVYLPLLALSLRCALEVPAEVLTQIDRVLDELGPARRKKAACLPLAESRYPSQPLLPMIGPDRHRRSALLLAASSLLGREEAAGAQSEAGAGLMFLLGPDAVREFRRGGEAPA